MHGRLGRPIVDIRHGPAADATDMLMRIDIAVETGLAPAAFQPLDHPRLGQLIEVSIDRSQTDAGQPPADDVEQVRGGGVGVEPAEFLDDEVPLARVSLWGCDGSLLTAATDYQ